MKITRGREPWTREAVWRKLDAFNNELMIRKFLKRSGKNERDIMFSLRTARDFLLDSNTDLITSLIHSYYGAFWVVLTMIMIKDENCSLENITHAVRFGHGMYLKYDINENNPSTWNIFITKSGFMNFVLTKAPFTCDVNAVCLPDNYTKKDIDKNYKELSKYGYSLDNLMSRFPEMSWHYELLTNKPAKSIGQDIKEKPPFYAYVSQKATTEFIKNNFPHIKDLKIKEKENRLSADDFLYEIECDSDWSKKENNPILYSTLLANRNVIALMDKPLKEPIIWHCMFCYAWSIVARYSPNIVQRIQIGDLAHWKQFLTEYNWLVRIILSTECLNVLTDTEWKFTPPALWGG